MSFLFGNNFNLTILVQSMMGCQRAHRYKCVTKSCSWPMRVWRMFLMGLVLESRTYRDHVVQDCWPSSVEWTCSIYFTATKFYFISWDNIVPMRRPAFVIHVLTFVAFNYMVFPYWMSFLYLNIWYVTVCYIGLERYSASITSRLDQYVLIAEIVIAFHYVLWSLRLMWLAVVHTVSA